MNKLSFMAAVFLAIAMQVLPGAAETPGPACKSFDLSPEHDSITLDGAVFRIANLGGQPVVLVTSVDSTPIMLVPPLSQGNKVFMGDENLTYVAKLQTPGGKTTIMVC